MAGFKVGELILSCEPYVYTLRSEFKNLYCDFCFRQNNQLKKCARCSYTYYCDKSCQTKAWSLHQTECKYLKKCDDDEKPDTLVRCIALIIFKIKKYGLDIPSVELNGRKVSFATLMSHSKDIKEDTKVNKMVEYLYILLQNFIGPENTPSLDELFEIYGKTRINVFSILDVSESIGLGLYLGASVFDHSCDPDALSSFDGTTLNVRMRKNVSHRIIDQVCISYLDDLIQLTGERQKTLLEKYYFHCECKYCLSSYDDLMMKLLNDSDEVKKKALKCEKEFKGKEQEIKNLLLKSPKLGFEECKKLLKDQSKVLADTNVYKVKTLHIALLACVMLQSSKDVIELASKLEKHLRLYLGNIHPDLGSFLLYYGKHLCLSGFSKEGESKLVEAENMLKTIYGEQHPHYKEMENFMIDFLSKNLNALKS